MNTTTDFTSNFWNIYTAAIVLVSFIGLVWLLISQNKTGSKNSEGEVETMGHEWDGIEEYNNPLPRWWFYLFVITVIFGIVYLVLYPGFASFKGVLGWTSTNQYEKEMEVAAKQYQPLYDKYKAMSIEEVAQDPEAKIMGQNMFNTYCIQCHGSDAKGAKGFPNLTDDDWLWGSSPEAIKESIQYGRIGVMQPRGGLSADEINEQDVIDVSNYIISINENPEKAAEANKQSAAKGKLVYDKICVTCHMEDGKGALGTAPNLTDNIWLWGGREADIINTVTHGHTNEMPAWEHFLTTTDAEGNVIDDSKLHILTAYVWGLSHANGQQDATPVTENQESNTASEVSFENSDGVINVYFPVGQFALADSAKDELQSILTEAEAGKTVVISGYHDATGNLAANEELAKNRAKAVKDILIANGVSADKIELLKPEVTEGDGNNTEARRVEVSVK